MNRKKRSKVKPKPAKTGKKSSPRKTHFNRNYNNYMKQLSKRFGIDETEASIHLGSAMKSAFDALMLKDIRNDEYYSAPGKNVELKDALSGYSTQDYSKRGYSKRGANRTHKKHKLTRKRGSTMNTCSKCSNGNCSMKSCSSCSNKLSNLTRPASRSRIFKLTPRALDYDNVNTMMSGFSTTRVCSRKNGGPLSCEILNKKY